MLQHVCLTTCPSHTLQHVCLTVCLLHSIRVLGVKKNKINNYGIIALFCERYFSKQHCYAAFEKLTCVYCMLTIAVQPFIAVRGFFYF